MKRLFKLAVAFVFIIALFIATMNIIAVTTGGAGHENPEKFPGHIDVDRGYAYLGATTTPSLGTHDEHGVIYPKSDTKLYYLYDKAGETEYEVALIDDGTLLVANLGSGVSYVTTLYASTGYFTQIEATDINVDQIDVTTINNTTLNVTEIKTTDFQGYEKSSDPATPAEGHYKIWMSDGTGKGDDGDVLIVSTAGGTTTYKILFDKSAGGAW